MTESPDHGVPPGDQEPGDAFATSQWAPGLGGIAGEVLADRAGERRTWSTAQR